MKWSSLLTAGLFCKLEISINWGPTTQATIERNRTKQTDMAKMSLKYLADGTGGLAGTAGLAVPLISRRRKREKEKSLLGFTGFEFG